MTEQPDTVAYRRMLIDDELLATDVLDLIQALDRANARIAELERRPVTRP